MITEPFPIDDYTVGTQLVSGHTITGVYDDVNGKNLYTVIGNEQGSDTFLSEDEIKDIPIYYGDFQLGQYVDSSHIIKIEPRNDFDGYTYTLADGRELADKTVSTLVKSSKTAEMKKQGLYPLRFEGIDGYRSGVKVRYSLTIKRESGNNDVKRGQCKEITKKAITNAQHVLSNTDIDFPSLINLTYPTTYPTDGRIAYQHVKNLLQRIRDNSEIDFKDWFAAKEYQVNYRKNRHAPHFHILTDVDLSDYGELTELKRKNSNRYGYVNSQRSKKYETLLDLHHWICKAWIDILSKPIEIEDVVKDDGTVVKGAKWDGLPKKDIEKMEKSHFYYNSGVTWEVMRKKDGGQHYLVKELASLSKKKEQKTVPDNHTNVGRHFWYSKDVKPKKKWSFDSTQVDEKLLRSIIEDEKHMPKNGDFLYKMLWNMSDVVYNALTDMERKEFEHDDIIEHGKELRAKHDAEKSAKFVEDALKHAKQREILNYNSDPPPIFYDDREKKYTGAPLKSKVPNLGNIMGFICDTYRLLNDLDDLA